MRSETRNLSFNSEHAILGQAAAHRHALRANNEKDRFAHPMVCAPFVVVDEGGTPM